MSFDSQFETMLIQVDNQETTKKTVFGNLFYKYLEDVFFVAE